MSNPPALSPAAFTRLQRLAVAVLLAGFAAIYWVSSVHLGAHQHLQTDDVFTLWMIQTPSLIDALKVGADTAPPGFYYLMHASCAVFGYNDLGIRLPTILAMFVFMAGIFLLLRRYVGEAVAGAAAILPLFGSAGETALFARPPALMMMSFSLLCLVWASDTSRHPKVWRSVAIAALLGFAISMHFYSVLFVPTMCLLEFVWATEHRAIRVGHWLGILGGACVLLLWLPVIGPIYKMTHGSAQSPSYYAHPTPLNLIAFLHHIAMSTGIANVLLLLILVGGVYQWVRVCRREPLPALSPSEDSLGAVGFAAAAFPLLTYVFTMVVTHVFNERYIVSSALGLSIALALLMRTLRWSRGMEVLLLAIVVALYAKGALPATHGKVSPTTEYEQIIGKLPGDEPVALPDGGSWVASQGSEDPAIRNRTVYLFLPLGFKDDDTEPTRVAVAWHKMRPELPIYRVEDLLARYHGFYVLTWHTPGEGLLPWATTHLKTEIVSVQDGMTVYHFTQP